MASLSKKAAAAPSSKPGTPGTLKSVSLAKKRRAAKDGGHKVSEKSWVLNTYCEIK